MKNVWDETTTTTTTTFERFNASFALDQKDKKGFRKEKAFYYIRKSSS